MLSREVLSLDPAATVDELCGGLRSLVRGAMRRGGAVLGLSGGIDSSVTAALCARALGPDRVFGLFMPERDSAAESLALGRELAATLGIRSMVEPIGPIVAAAGCYERQDEAIRMVFPDYEAGWRFKVSLPSILDGDRLNVSELTVQDAGGQPRTARLGLQPYLQLIAATNFKQRIRKMMEYYHADRLNFAVAGTPNRLEFDQGFYVKQGDGAADVKPIAHLYKTQVYQLAGYLGVPEAIRSRPPTTDTFSLPQTQEEFYFALPYDQMDLCLYGHNHGIPAADVAATIGLEAGQVERVYRDIVQKRRSTRYLRMHPRLLGDVAEVDH
jgi:NAD+ synthase